MSTTYAPPAHARRPHVSRWVVAIAVLAAALVGLGVWALVDRSSGSGATEDATTLIDDVDAAWSAGDTSALSALYANDAVVRSLGDTFGAKAISSGALGPPVAGFHVERVAPVTREGDFATTFVKISGIGLDETPVLAVFQLKDGKIVRHWGFGMGTTTPFDNAVGQ